MKRSVLLLLAVLAAAACVKREVTVAGNLGPSLVVEQFMRAANARDLAAMGRLFGTSDGPVQGRWPKSEIEQRMFIIATELKHQDFAITSEQIVPGRGSAATRLSVKLTKDGKDYTVPFTLVRYKENSWLVEQIGIDVITAPRS